jgi:hypothetical protein
MPHKRTGMPTARELGSNPRSKGANPRAKAKSRWALRAWKAKQKKAASSSA